ncbi:xyloglucan galactosyltransferase XLT2-like [Benincasa hispida]|uniref:xyloglucan galactosyltransferase XLT2-like n=1 Tax=Benincasa hispida TaxID=102211 RepID=UPI001901BDEC|nr:xyloglucan galactosyltransferase XLT2-like [Benincasa hispida]
MNFKINPKAFSPNSFTRFYPSWILVLTVIFLQIYLIFTTTCSAPLSLAASRDGRQSSKTVTGDPCSSGRVFVYDLPPIFNKELLENCESLDPWTSRCDDVSNGGFGRQATELIGVVPDGLAPAWFWSEQYMLEPIIHNRILNHKCRTLEPESATAFYIPFYAGLSIGRFLWMNYTTSDRDRDSEKLIKWVQNQPYWNRSNGGDHFITLGRLTWDFKRWGINQWGSSFAFMPGMKNVARLIVEREPSDPLDIGVPFPTGFHPRSDADVLNWQSFVRERNRTKLFCFAGGTRHEIKNDFRAYLLSYCINESAGSCRGVKCTGNRCASGDSAVLETFLDSDFCLQPKGDSYSRKSVFDCLLTGSIPVIFWERTAYGQYEWFLPGEPGSYSVFIDHKEVRNGSASIREVLEKFSREKVRKMREKVIETIPKIVYASAPEGLESIKDAFDIALNGIFKRFNHRPNSVGKWELD